MMKILARVTRNMFSCETSCPAKARIELNPIFLITAFLTDNIEMRQYVDRRLIYTQYVNIIYSIFPVAVDTNN